ncbi:hypothetical protein P280DRAFT_484749 [Massarina eburnea CBS 473.64]|uniref:Uncharacterized protein n=1 Tax=Massarina eburnea CBS 473.64 TaxID=1395130 RepID=A0A6A6RIP2_9PLEO|nr:hypothetical protein P280DRAFT_484749 [Massarina eburnea CBS 473.64]
MSTHVLSSHYSTPSSYTPSRASYPSTLIGRNSASYTDSGSSSYYTRLNEKSAAAGTIHLHSLENPREKEPKYYSTRPQSQYIEPKHAPRPQPQRHSQYIESKRWVEPEYEMYGRGPVMSGRYAEKRRWVEPQPEPPRMVKEAFNAPPPPSPATSLPPPRSRGSPSVVSSRERPQSMYAGPPKSVVEPPPAPRSFAGTPSPKEHVPADKKVQRVRFRDVIGGIIGRAGENIEKVGEKVGGRRWEEEEYERQRGAHRGERR